MSTNVTWKRDHDSKGKDKSLPVPAFFRAYVVSFPEESNLGVRLLNKRCGDVWWSKQINCSRWWWWTVPTFFHQESPLLFLVDWHIHIAYVPIVSYCILILSPTNSCCYDWYAIIFLRCCLQLHPICFIKLSATKTKVPGQKPPGAQAESMAWFGLLWLGNTTLPAQRFIFWGDLKETFFFLGGVGGKMHHNWNTSHLESSWIKMFVSWKLQYFK